MCLSQDNHVSLEHKRMQHVAINAKSNKHNAYSFAKLALFPEMTDDIKITSINQ